MKSCALLINDLHVGSDNLAEFYTNWKWALNLCKEHSIKRMIIGGDLFLSRSGQTLSVLLAVRGMLLDFHKSDIEITIANGNHDLVDQEVLEGYAHVFSEYPGVTVVDDYLLYEISESKVLAVMSYFPENGSFADRLTEIIESIEKGSDYILYCHEGISGALGKPNDKELPASLFKPFYKVLAGHYHNRAVIPGTNIEYIGASRQHNFGEDVHKGATILYDNGDTLFIENDVNTRYITLSANSPKEAEEMMAEIKPSNNIKYKIKIACNEEESGSINKERLIALGASKIEVETKHSQTYSADSDITAKYDKSALVSEYTKFCIQKDVEDVDLGVSYLNKVN